MESRLILLCLICSIILCASFSLNAETDEEIERILHAEQAAYDQYKDFVSEIESFFALDMFYELGLRWSGVNSMMHGKVEVLGMKFHAPRRATMEEARALNLFVINKFLLAINEHEKIQPFLEERPFKPDRVCISIAFEGVNGRYSDGTVSRIWSVGDITPLSNCKFIYDAIDPYSGTSIDLFEESFEEAVKLNEATHIKNLAVHQTTVQEEEMDQLLAHFSDELSEQYCLSRWSIGGKMTNGVEEIGAKFTAFQSATHEEARQLLMQVVQKLLTSLNSNEKLRPYLKEFPFPSERVKMRICFRNDRYNSYKDGTMESVTLEGNEITYFQEPIRKNKKELCEISIDTPVFAKESYQEAQKIVENAPIADLKFRPKTYYEFVIDSIYNFFHSILTYLVLWLYDV